MLYSTIKISTLAITSLLVLQACASKTVEKEPVIDNTPLVRTAVITSNIRNNGFKGYFANDTVHVRKVMNNMRRTDNSMKFTGSILGRVGPKMDLSEIVRLDKNLEWQLDNRKKRYRECPVGKCWEQAGFRTDLYSEETAEEVETAERLDACPLTATENDFSIKKTGEQREVNGFDADQYVISWQMGFEDPEGKTMLNVITIDLWTTPETGVLAEAIAMENSFANTFTQYKSSELPENLMRAAPRGSMELLVKYMLRSVEDEHKEEINRMISNAATIEGFPISSKFQWDAKNDTCTEPEEPEEKEEDTLDTRSVEGLIASIGKQVLRQEVTKKKEAMARETELQPLLSVIEEVISIEIQDIRESQLLVPPNYKLDNRT